MLESILYLIIALLGAALVICHLKTRAKVREMRSALENSHEENTKIKTALNNLDEVDEINQIYTFKYFHHLVEREIERAERYNNKFSLLFIEVDNLKEIDQANQDTAFRNILDIIKTNIRLVDICFQNEISFNFIVVLAETDPAQARKITERIYNSVLKLEPGGVRMQARMGVVCYPVDGTLRRNLIEHSKICLEEAGKLADQRIVVFSEQSDRS
ncbi:MAG: diguanylate cyclase [Candidatus Wallbacteria bacterium]|nr:diguanylate cyclase [Candidatus Wallbacteria bacterium]